MATTIFHAAGKRGHANHGWLDTYHSFSFASWYDAQKVHFGALRVLNDDIIAGGEGFGKHPHDNMEIISIVLDGVLEHKDSMGHTQTIDATEVQVMSAGTGLMHSEYNHSSERPANLLQIWIYPNRKNVQPRYDQRAFDATARVNQLQNLVAPVTAPGDALKINQDAWIYRTTLEAGHTLEHKLNNLKNGAYVFVIDGKVSATEQTLKRRDALGISDTGSLTISALENSEVLIIEVPMKM